MKGKKFAALILAVVMALTMLTACGGGGGSVSLSEVNSLLAQQDVDVDVRSSGDLNIAVNQVASYLERVNTFNNTIANEYLAQMRGYPVTNGDKMRIGSGMCFSEQELGNTSVEQVVAAYALILTKGLEAEGLDQYITCYYASVSPAISSSGVFYYVIGVEVEFAKV